MRFNKSILCTILFTLFLGIGVIDAQVRVVNEDGDVIILMPDGKWKYEDEKKESQRKDKNSPPPKNVVPASRQNPKTKKTTTKKGTKNTTAKGVESKKTKKAKKSKKNTKKPSKTKPSTTATKQKKSKKSNKSTTAKSNKKSSNKKPKTVTSKSKRVKQKKRKAMVYAVPKRERKIKAPVIPDQMCEYSMKERDEFTNKLKVATKPQPFFEYTQEDLKKFMREDDYLTCSGNLSRVVGMTIFNVKFEIESPIAQQEYGTIEAGTQMLVKLLNDETVILTCQESDRGTVDESSGTTVYRTYFGVDKNDEKMLKKSEVVKVRMLWSTGFEDYEVNELDFFINQLKCLDAVKD